MLNPRWSLGAEVKSEMVRGHKADRLPLSSTSVEEADSG